ncbi:flavodoxin-ferredoxin fusion protein [Blattamonas nauphoetae]|uniref:Flavodoxin-ferredoxin fusion protein n=1 Tax=Blattamonas nauphoetae TaxID=2049346 RepID=A0ABQ9XCS4_9EUKA|nr:flavodoxin-ferredoxin fusion protein [Blattamonas nauphoetae]
MKVVLLYFSTTGNTKHVTMLAKKALEGAGHSVALHDGFAMLKEYVALGETSVTPLTAKYQADVAEAEVIGIGAYVSFFTVPDGFMKILNERNSPSSIFGKMKYYFVYTTFGNEPGKALEFVATQLSLKNKNAKYLGGVFLQYPENAVPLQAPRGTYDAERPEEKKKEEEMHEIVTETIHPEDNKPTAMFGPMVVDPSKCIRCYSCVSHCAYNAMTKPEAGSAVKIPTWNADNCFGCCACFNFCPVRAIEIPGGNSSEREQYYFGRSTAGLKETPPLPRGQVYSRMTISVPH